MNQDLMKLADSINELNEKILNPSLFEGIDLCQCMTQRNIYLDLAKEFISKNFDDIFKDIIWNVSGAPSFEIVSKTIPTELVKLLQYFSNLETCKAGTANYHVIVDDLIVRIILGKTGNWITIDVDSTDAVHNIKRISTFIYKHKMKVDTSSVIKWSETQIKLISLANNLLPASYDFKSLGEIKNA